MYYLQYSYQRIRRCVPYGLQIYRFYLEFTIAENDAILASVSSLMKVFFILQSSSWNHSTIVTSFPSKTTMINNYSLLQSQPRRMPNFWMVRKAN